MLAIQDAGKYENGSNARFVAYGHREKLEKSLDNDITVAKKHSVKRLAGLASIFHFRLFSTTVTQACILSKASQKQNIFVESPKKFGLETDELFILLNPIYGLSESGDY